MNEMEVTGLLGMLADVYVNAPAATDARVRVRIWHEVLEPYEARPVWEAAKQVARSDVRHPTPARILEVLAQSANGVMPSEEDAWFVCTSQQLPPDLHPVLRECLAITGGVNTLAWCDEGEMRRRIRSAYWRGMRSYQAALATADSRALEQGGTQLRLNVFKTIDEALEEGDAPRPLEP